ncbi:unnamed protein product [Sympodiomycopsis kandeliae]
MMAEPSHRTPSSSQSRHFLAIDPASASASSSSPPLPPNTSRRIQRSVTDTRIATSSSHDPTSGSPRVPASTFNKPSSSYFDTYRPYKLNPALTPSLRPSKSKPDLSSSSKSRQKAKDVSPNATPSREPSRSRDKKPTQQTVPSSSSPSSPSRSPKIEREPRTSKKEEQLSSSRSTQVEKSLRSETSRQPPVPTTTPQSERLNAQSLADLQAASATADRAASVESWRKVAAAAAQRSPGGYSSARVVAGVTRRKSGNDLQAMAASQPGSSSHKLAQAVSITDNDKPKQAATAATAATAAVSSPLLWRQRQHAITSSSRPSKDTPMFKPDHHDTDSTHAEAYSHRHHHHHHHHHQHQQNRDDSHQSSSSVPASSKADLQTRHRPSTAVESDITTSSATATVVPSAATVTEKPAKLAAPLPSLSASRQALGTYSTNSVPSIEAIVRDKSSARSSPPLTSAPSSEYTEDIPATFAASPKGMGRRSGSARKVVKQSVRSIEDIIREHSQLAMATPKHSSPPPYLAPSPMDRRVTSNPVTKQISRHVDDASLKSDSASEASLDSITREAREMAVSPESGQWPARNTVTVDVDITARSPRKPRRLHHATSFPARAALSSPPPAVPPMPSIVRSVTSGNVPGTVQWPAAIAMPNEESFDGRQGHLRQRTTSLASANSGLTSLSRNPETEGTGVPSFVRSHRLTKIVSLPMSDASRLQVSLADVGSPSGHPVFVYLGLGAVRYLIGLYDELASLFGIRLICVDRWGLGKTDDVPSDQRGVLEWSVVISKVADALSLSRFSLLAHSAGAPYAMATALLLRDRICGPVHLLAPWVSPEMEPSYKWLRFVPEQVIRTAQAAEWRLAGWRLGRNPDVVPAPAAGTPNSNAGVSLARKASSGSSEQQHTPVTDRGDTSTFSSRDSDYKAIPSTTMRIALPSPITAPKPPGSDLRTPSKVKTSFLGSFFGGGNKNVLPPADDSDFGLNNSTNLPSADSWPQHQALSPSMRSDEDTWVASRDWSTPESTQVEFPPTSWSGADQKIGYDNPIMSETQSSVDQFIGDESAEILADFDIAPGRLDWEKSRDSGSFGRSSRSGSNPVRTRHSSTFGNRSIRDGVLEQEARVSSPMAMAGGRESRPSHELSPRLFEGGTPVSSRHGHMTDGAISTTVGVSSTTVPATPVQGTPAPCDDLATSLLRASHAESQRGSTKDLLTILGGRGSRPWGFSFADVQHPTKVWHGDKDERIGLGGVFWMERQMPDCRIKIVKGANHSLMTNTAVVIEALESISAAWQQGS